MARKCFKQVVPVALLLAWSISCDRDESIRRYDAPKDRSAPVETLSLGPGQTSERTQPAGEIQWDVPTGWTKANDEGSGGMRFATFQVDPGNPKVVLTVVRLPPDAGKLMPNLNRWEGQLGLPVSTSEDAAAKHLRAMQIAGGMATVVDLANADQRMLAAIVEHGQVWFFKLVGPKDVVTAQKEKFDAFVKSARFESGTVSQASADASKPAPAGSGLGSYITPEGWKLEPARPMRALSFKIDAAGQSGEMIVTRLSANGFGNVLDNINRWRSQVGLEPVTSAPQPENMTIGGRRVAVYDFAGPGAVPSNAAVAGAKRIRVGTVMNGPDAWFFKLQGSTELVEQQKPAFEKFISSVKLGGPGE